MSVWKNEEVFLCIFEDFTPHNIWLKAYTPLGLHVDLTSTPTSNLGYK